MRSILSNKAADELAAIVLGSKEAADAMKRRLNAHNGASKRSKSKTRVVGRRKPKIALERDLCANLKNACDALAEAVFEVRNHPYLPGVKCRSDGAIYVPPRGVHEGHWTMGGLRPTGYRQVGIGGAHYYAHRIVCEAFHGRCPEGMEVDHIDRNPSNNAPDNLYWATRSENQRNRKICDDSFAKYGVHSVDDFKAYDKAYKEIHKEEQRERCRRYYHEHREERLAYARGWYQRNKAKKNAT